MFEEKLEGIGLSKREIKVYLSLLKIGETTTGKIIDKTGIAGGKIYEVLQKLIQKGLATYIVKEKTKYFQAAPPEKLIEYIETKEHEISKRKKDVLEIIPNLQGLLKASEKSSQAIIYKGMEGLKSAIMQDIKNLKKGDEYLALGVSEKRTEAISIIWDQFEIVRKKQKVGARFIAVDKETAKSFKDSYKCEAKVLTASESVPITISKNCVIIYNYENSMLIKIHDKNVANSFKEFFEYLWKISK